MNVQKLAGHSDIKTTQKYYLAVEENYLEKARGVQSEILRNDLTDPKLTHFGKNGKFFKESKKPENFNSLEINKLRNHARQDSNL